MNETETFARKPRPLLRSIEWQARPENGEHRSAEDVPRQPPFEIFLTQRLLRAVERHLSEQADGTGWGLLAGEVHECPVSGRRWVLATDVLAGPGSFDEDGSRQVPDEGELALQLKAERDGRVVVGWYHGHATGRPRFTARDRTTNERLSADPWQFGLLLVQEGMETSGAVMHAAVDEGRTAVPFHEVVGNDALMADGGRRTCLAWTNLVTEVDVVAAVPEPSNAAGRSSPAEGTADEGVDGASADGGQIGRAHV